MAKFWLTFLDMVTILLNTIHATRCRNWDLYLDCVSSIILYVFTYEHLNHYNYAKYLAPMLGELLNLPTNHPFIHEQFMLGKFSMLLSSVNPFVHIEADKVIETIINKDKKCTGGWKEFSTKSDTVTQQCVQNIIFEVEISISLSFYDVT